MRGASFSIEPLPPFRLDLTDWALRRRANNCRNRWDGRIYRRMLIVDCETVEIAVEQAGPAKAPQLGVTVAGCSDAFSVRADVTRALEGLLGFSIDMGNFNRLAAADPALAPLAQRFSGFKPPRFPTVFEALVNAIACQQVTLTLGILLLSRLAANFGPAMT